MSGYQPESPADDDFTDGKSMCFCDIAHGDADMLRTCGDCPRDYIAGAWDARRKYLMDNGNDTATPNALDQGRDGVKRWADTGDACEACRKCGGEMKPSKAIAQTLTGRPDFPGKEVVTISPGGPGRLIDCMKCEKCGHSVT